MKTKYIYLLTAIVALILAIIFFIIIVKTEEKQPLLQADPSEIFITQSIEDNGSDAHFPYRLITKGILGRSDSVTEYIFYGAKTMPKEYSTGFWITSNHEIRSYLTQYYQGPLTDSLVSAQFQKVCGHLNQLVEDRKRINVDTCKN